MVSCGIVGLAKSYANSYTMFVALELADAALGSGTFLCSFVLGMELLGPSRRTLGGQIVMCSFSLGGVVLGAIAWFAQHFRTLLRIVYAPALATVALCWLIPESSRWLMCRGRCDEATAIIRGAAKVNGVKLSAELLEQMDTNCGDRERILQQAPPSSGGGGESIGDIFKSKIMLWRTVTCSFCWIVITFVSYGLMVNSVELTVGGNKYENFMLTNAIEIPAFLLTYIVMKSGGRRSLLCGTMVVSGLACLGSATVLQLYAYDDDADDDGSSSTQVYAQMILFFIGKFAITSAFGILYVYTSEIFPTSMRNSMMSSCSMMGRIGSMLAPQTPMLVNISYLYII